MFAKSEDPDPDDAYGYKLGMTPRDAADVRLLVIKELASKSRPVPYKELRRGVIAGLCHYHDINESDLYGLVTRLVIEGVVESDMSDSSLITYWLSPLQKIAAI